MAKEVIGRGWLTIAAIKDGKDGATGAKGDKGNDAGVMTFSPATLALSAVRKTDGSYIATLGDAAKAQARVMLGTTDVTSKCSYVVVQSVNCTATVGVGGLVTITSVSRQTINGLAVPYTDALVQVRATHATTKQTYDATLYVKVEMSVLWGGLETSVSGLKSQYNEVSTAVGKIPIKTATELERYTSTINQTAREISLKVGKTLVGRHNLFVGSAFRRADEGAVIDANGSSYIQMLDGVDGANSYHAKVTYSGSAQPVAAVWNCGGKGSQNIAIKKGTTYTLSCYVRRGDTNGQVFAEAYYKDNASTNASARKGKLLGANFAPPSVGTWQLMTTTFSIPAGASYDFVEVVIYLTVPTKGKTSECWLCQPMLAEGDSYHGWSLSERDHAYIGGNLLPGSKDLFVQAGGTVQLTHTGEIVDGAYDGCAVISNSYKSAQVDTLIWHHVPCEADTDYVLSFWARGTGRTQAYMHNNSEASTLVNETSQGSTSGAGWGGVTLQLSDTWQRYWVHFHTQSKTVIDATANASLSYYIIIGRLQNSGDTVEISKPKLEKGAAMTDYVSTSASYIEEGALAAALQETGFDITNRTITATADNFLVRNNAGVTVAAVDKNGSFRTSSLHTENADGTLRVDIEDGMFSVTTGRSFAGIKIGIDDNGDPLLLMINADGTVGCVLGNDGLNNMYVPKKSVTLVGTPSGDFTATQNEMSMPGGKRLMIALSYYLRLTVKNVSGNALRIPGNVLKVTVVGPRGEKWTMLTTTDQVVLNNQTLELVYNFTTMISATSSDGTYISVGDKAAYMITLANGLQIGSGQINRKV